MLKTEAEAKQSMCPYRHATGAERPPRNMLNPSPVVWVHFYFCYGPDCMAWRWHDKHSERRVRMPATQEQARCPEEPERPADLPASWEWCGDLWECDGENNCWVEPGDEANTRRSGYCGLAGKVEYI